MRRAELITGLVTAAVGAYALEIALHLALFGSHRVPGPGFFPRLLSSLLMLLGLLLAASSLRRPRTGRPADRQAGRAELRRELRAGTVWLCFAISAPLLAVLGFVPATALLVFTLLFAVEGRRNWKSVLVAVVIPVATSTLFVSVLTIPLPSGLLSHGPLGI